MPKPRPLFRSTLVPFVLDYLRAHGVDPARIAPPPGSHAPGDRSVSLPVFRALLDDAASALGDPFFGLHCGSALPVGTYELPEFAVRSAATLREALGELVELGGLINPGVRFSSELTSKELLLHHRVLGEPAGLGRQGNLFTVALLLHILRQVIAEEVVPTRVWFAHAQRGRPQPVIDHFGTANIAFGCDSNGLGLNAALLDARLRSADPALHAVLVKHTRALATGPEDLASAVRRAVRASLPRPGPSLNDAAKRLHLSERTLQRRLGEEGLQFAELVTAVRVELARALLADASLPLTEVAERLGYVDASTFTRAFKGWLGITPGAHRAALTPSAHVSGVPSTGRVRRDRR